MMSAFAAFRTRLRPNICICIVPLVPLLRSTVTRIRETWVFVSPRTAYFERFELCQIGGIIVKSNSIEFSDFSYFVQLRLKYTMFSHSFVGISKLDYSTESWGMKFRKTET